MDSDGVGDFVAVKEFPALGESGEVHGLF